MTPPHETDDHWHDDDPRDPRPIVAVVALGIVLAAVLFGTGIIRI